MYKLVDFFLVRLIKIKNKKSHLAPASELPTQSPLSPFIQLYLVQSSPDRTLCVSRISVKNKPSFFSGCLCLCLCLSVSLSLMMHSWHCFNGHLAQKDSLSYIYIIFVCMSVSLPDPLPGSQTHFHQTTVACL